MTPAIKAIYCNELWFKCLNSSNDDIHDYYFEKQQQIYNQLVSEIGTDATDQLLDTLYDNYHYIVRNNSGLIN